MKLPKNFKKYVEWSFYAFLFFLVVGSAGGFYLWKTYEPKMVELEGKDPDRFEEMVTAAKDVELPKALSLYKEIDAMTEWEVYLLRHEKWKKKWEEDPEFRDAHLESRSDRYDALKVSRLEKYDQKSQQLEILRTSSATGKKVAWQKKSPWEKGVLLKEACLRYRQLEQRYSIDRRRMDQPARHESFVLEERSTGLSPAEECDLWIEIGHTPQHVERSLQKIRRAMNYYFFKRMSGDLGLPDEALPDLEKRLAKMTNDFEAY